MFYKGDNFRNFLFALLHNNFLLKRINSEREGGAPLGSTLKDRSLLPKGYKFFPSRVDTFSEERQNNIDKVASPENASIHLKMLLAAI